MQLRTEIEIAAPPAVVWEVLTHTSAYAEWNPFIAQIEGDLTEGSRLNILLTPSGGSEMRIRPRLLQVDAPHELRWRGKLYFSFLFQGEHFFRLEETEDGRTRLEHGEDFSGVLLRFAGGILTKTARSFVLMNQALKRRVEERAQSPHP